MTKTLATRLDALEARRRPATAGPGWLSFADEAALSAYLAQPHSGAAVKVYITVSPDDWDGEP